MMLKSATTKPEAENDDTGTFADGFFRFVDIERVTERRETSPYERDYSANRNFARAAVGFA